MPQYEKHQLARNIRTFFENVPQEQPHPYPFGFDYWDAVKVIEPQLDDPACVEEIHQMMVPIWKATPQRPGCTPCASQAFENLTASGREPLRSLQSTRSLRLLPCRPGYRNRPKKKKPQTPILYWLPRCCALLASLTVPVWTTARMTLRRWRILPGSSTTPHSGGTL